MEGIMLALTEAALTQQQGGGIGMNFSTLRPAGAIVRRTGSVSSGIIPFMRMWNSM
jgi:ribonucleoside-diphosphate reductase alpha chain